mmetsp:Transcript_16231/g.61529  ORF Transcript_16231/g.61529 Transcript_16231/m.61529 type:complete len:234 (+) Transcript_16231:456-1157(+)
MPRVRFRQDAVDDVEAARRNSLVAVRGCHRQRGQQDRDCGFQRVSVQGRRVDELAHRFHGSSGHLEVAVSNPARHLVHCCRCIPSDGIRVAACQRQKRVQRRQARSPVAVRKPVEHRPQLFTHRHGGAEPRAWAGSRRRRAPPAVRSPPAKRLARAPGRGPPGRLASRGRQGRAAFRRGRCRRRAGRVLRGGPGHKAVRARVRGRQPAKRGRIVGRTRRTARRKDGRAARAGR